MYISVEVACELDRPKFRRSHEALRLVRGVPLVPVNEDVPGLARLPVHEKVLPGPAAGDAVHVAASTVHAIEYMPTWNVKHLANPSKVEHLRAICIRLGLPPPPIVTPELLWERENGTD